MISFIKSWTITIIFAIVLLVIIEMIIPEGNNKKYIKVIMGIYFLLVILNPLLNKISKNTNLENLIDFSKVYQENIVEVGAIDTNSDLEYIAKESLKNEVNNILNQYGYNGKNIEIDLKINEEKTTAEIENISIILEKKESESNIESVNKVEINVQVDKETIESQETEIANKEEINKIKGILSEELGIKKQNITLSNRIRNIMKGKIT